MEISFPTPLLAFGLILLLAGIGFSIWYRMLRKAQRTIAQCNTLITPVITQLQPELENETLACQIWLETLQINGYLAPLYGSGSMVVLGTPVMGLSAVLKGVVKKINEAFTMSRHMGVYIDIASLSSSTATIESCFPEEIYRLIISNMVDPLLFGLQEQLGKRLYLVSGLQHLDAQIKALCANSIVEMPTAAIGETLVALWKITDIRQVKLCLDNVSAISPNHLPHLLHLIMRTFETTGRSDLVIGGDLDQLKLMMDTSEGPVGIQFGHDIFLGLNLQDILLPSTDNIQENVPPDGPRAEFIERILKKDGEKSDYTLNHFQQERLVHPGLWVLPFSLSHGNLDHIMDAILKVNRQYRQTHLQITQSQLEELCRQP